MADTKVMSEFLHREGGRYWTTIDGVRQLYRRIECKMRMYASNPGCCIIMFFSMSDKVYFPEIT